MKCNINQIYKINIQNNNVKGRALAFKLKNRLIQLKEQVSFIVTKQILGLASTIK